MCEIIDIIRLCDSLPSQLLIMSEALKQVNLSLATYK